ncbi:MULTISPECIES: response regulator [Pseudoalteromonas]|uniref:Response regulator containing CheY-like receiver, AAA-type ATPase, and DNA-binding domain protein n=2 Tax=Pseudoalteromonas luteoviolacea TaxID=43657 RepID=V4J6U1_PSEL2|nr:MULTISPECIES: response regulator [Pseudoalteromonas]ESP91022.1 response regulator containing CheY-like receiver, AAA-type ATPase, and DNA-binding domain protein [Pseudoalteromonas luteoviolacea 2ta16]KZN30247.1 chemotaxis protein CheY [Pseudoalteromonas luteoviolacea S2607]KZN38220.1 chemotaxis protein CheY [Pseudoalteromonas luteoviolacea NCIMB 1944]KZN61622.1 chemotaxis protein CheY [Pseudoalteromonas luteoviolacea S4060-1]MCG7547653.1 response regulator [Pseudoalteromonas sp. Of7M-16]
MSKTILVVDDSDSLRQVVNIALTGAGFNVIEARDGKDALTKLNGNKIHLIISDVNMPNMNGIEFVKQAKQLPQYKFTPVIMLTTENQQSMMEEGKKAGAKAWMVKPFKPAQMLQAVSKLLMM